MLAKCLSIIRDYLLLVFSQRKYTFNHQNTLLDAFRTNSRKVIGRNPLMVIPSLANQDLTPMLMLPIMKQTDVARYILQNSYFIGTGSGLGTYVLRLLEDEFPDVYRFNIPVYPSVDDDVITSPYNCVLATRQLTDGADCVMPIENQVGE